jgi:hypothetical protein
VRRIEGGLGAQDIGRAAAGLQAVQLGLGGSEVGLRLRHLEPQLLVVEPSERLPLGYTVAALRQHFGHLPALLKGNGYVLTCLHFTAALDHYVEVTFGYWRRYGRGGGRGRPLDTPEKDASYQGSQSNQNEQHPQELRPPAAIGEGIPHISNRSLAAGIGSYCNHMS